jgi:hypothetical protein
VHVPRLRLALAVVAATLAAGIGSLLLVGTGDTERSKTSGQAPDRVSCERALLHDWVDGRIDRAYPIGCYRAALKSLPTDLQIYSSAPEDISQALSRRIVQSAHMRSIARVQTR